jgi:hypothetical protein
MKNRYIDTNGTGRHPSPLLYDANIRHINIACRRKSVAGVIGNKMRLVVCIGPGTLINPVRSETGHRVNGITGPPGRTRILHARMRPRILKISDLLVMPEPAHSPDKKRIERNRRHVRNRRRQFRVGQVLIPWRKHSGNGTAVIIWNVGVVVQPIHFHTRMQRFQVGVTTGNFGPHLGVQEIRNRYRRQYSDYGDDNQQFDKCEGVMFHVRSFVYTDVNSASHNILVTTTK